MHLEERIAEQQRIAKANGETILEDPSVALPRPDSAAARFHASGARSVSSDSNAERSRVRCRF